MKTTFALFCASALALLPAVTCKAAQPAPPPAIPATPAPPPTLPPLPSNEDIYQQGKALFDAFAPPEIKAQFEFPTQAQWEDFAAHLDTALATGSLADLATYEPDAKLALTALRAFPEDQDYADWLAAMIDEIDAAKESQAPPPPPPVATAPKRGEPPPSPSVKPSSVPLEDLWLRRLRSRPPPTQAAALLPPLKSAFTAAGLPPSLVWLAEAESGFNPSARSPVGARGLFQLMPATAHDLGLSTFLPDERTDPVKSARASAQMLARLHQKFGDWPLALAAYNAGEGRVSRLLESKHATAYADIADALPGETRMYVPKVLALVQLREGVDLSRPQADGK